MASAPFSGLPATDADFVLRISPDRELLAVSDTLRDLVGEQLLRLPAPELALTLLDDAQLAAVTNLFERVLSAGAARMTLQLCGDRWADVSAKHMLDEPGRPVLVVARDVTDDVVARSRLAESEHQWRVAFE